MYSIVNGRSPRSKTQMYNSIHHPFANYYTEALQKTEMKMDYENEIFLNNLHLIPDPLMKNLADTLVTSEKPEKVKKQSLDTPIMKVKKQSLDTPMMAEPSTMDVRADSTLAGITNFFSGVFNMLSGAVFRTKSPVRYHDCFDEARQGSPQSWRSANDDQDKNGQVPEPSSGKPNGAQDMNNCKTISSCEEKLNQVKCLLTKPSKPSDKTPAWRKRPKRVFVEPGLAEDSFEDAFSSEDLVALSNDQYIEYFSPPQYQNEELIETEAPRTKIEPPPAKESMEIVKVIDCEKNMNEPCDLTEVTQDSDKNTDSGDEKQQLVSSCEDKLSKLKALLQEKRKKPKLVDPSPEQTLEPKPTKTIPISKPVDKHFKNRHRMLDKRRKMKIKHSIQDDVIFANEIDLDSPAESPSTPSTVNSDTSLGEYFDEMKGRFHSTSTTESEDSFQIVFNDSPKHTRKASDCESEDSFIVFEDDCYTSNDVFGDSDSESDESDVSDSGCSTMTCKLSHSLSRTVSNLTDDTLYESSDEVDCAKMEPEARGLLVDATRKSLRKNQPPKKVHFSTEPPTVKVMRVWAFAARQARAGHWERYALDRDRFKRRIADVDMAVSWVLKPQHRSRVMFQRFMPLWNRQRRQELEEKKVREKEEKRLAEERKEEERIEAEREEERRIEEEMEEDRRIEEEVLEEMRQEALMRMKDKIHDIMNRDTHFNVKKMEKVPDKVRRYDRNGQLIDSPPTPEAELNLPKNNVRNCENIKMTNGIKDDEIDERNNNVLKSETQISDSVTDITDKLESSKLVEPINVNEEIGT